VWARLCEIVIGLWLIASPHVLPGDYASMAVDYAAGGCVLLLAFASFWRRTRHAHLVTAVLAILASVAVWLTAPVPSPPIVQSRFLAALTLLMLAIVPNRASQPADAWRAE
jgi:hypothetical protein